MISLKEFSAAKEKLEQKIKNLLSEKKGKEQLQKEVNMQYEQMLINDATGNSDYSNEEITQLKIQLNTLSAELSVLDERINMLQEAKPLKLKELVNQIREEYREEARAANDVIQSIFDEAKEMRKELLMKMHEAHKHLNYVEKLKFELNTVERESGYKYYEETSNLYVSTEPPIFDNNFGSKTISRDGVVPHPDDVSTAYKSGKLPSWVTAEK